MMKFTGICLVTENVPALVQFYTKILGCQAAGLSIHFFMFKKPQVF